MKRLWIYGFTEIFRLIGLSVRIIGIKIMSMSEEPKKAEVWVYETDGVIAGFIGLNDDYIAGIFVEYEYRSKGIGKELIDFAKMNRMRLSLDVYEKITEQWIFTKGKVLLQ